MAAHDDVVLLSEECIDVVRSGADDADRERRLPAATVDALDGDGLLRMFLPRAYGGPSLSPMAALERIAAVAAIDGAAGWCSMISSTTCALAGFLEPAVAAATFGSGRAFGGVFAPNGRFEVDADMATVTGRWQWGSGLAHCDQVVAGAVGPGGDRRTFVIAASDVTVHDTWHTMGMRGSGSVDFSVDMLPVSLDRSVAQNRPTPRVEDPICRFPNFALLAAAVASVGDGIARHAISELVALAGAHRPQFSSRPLAEHAAVQASVSQSTTSLSAASGHLRVAVASAWDRVSIGDPVPLESRIEIRSAAALLAATAMNVVDSMFALGGGVAVYDTSPLGRCLRDVHVVNQHIMVAPRLHETLGRYRLGLALDDGMI